LRYPVALKATVYMAHIRIAIRLALSATHPENAALNNVRKEYLPAVGVSKARCCVPGNCYDLAVALLNPNRVCIIEMYDCSQRYSAVEPICHPRLAGITCESTLQPCVASNDFRSGKCEVFHHPGGFCVLSKWCVYELIEAPTRNHAGLNRDREPKYPSARFRPLDLRNRSVISVSHCSSRPAARNFLKFFPG
jgi:hypothetical protein